MPSDMERVHDAPRWSSRTTVALSFISFWRAAAIVLSDLASSAFYAGGIAEHAIGQKRPLVHPRRHAVQLRRALGLHGKLAACSCAAASTWWCATPWARSWRASRSRR